MDVISWPHISSWNRDVIIDITYLEVVQIRAFGGSVGVGVAHVVGIIHTNECCDKDMIAIPKFLWKLVLV